MKIEKKRRINEVYHFQLWHIVAVEWFEHIAHTLDQSWLLEHRSHLEEKTIYEKVPED